MYVYVLYVCMHIYAIHYRYVYIYLYHLIYKRDIIYTYVHYTYKGACSGGFPRK